MVKIRNKKVGLGSEHPHCDEIQLTMIITFFVVWGVDSLVFFIFGYSTVLVTFISVPVLLLPAILLIVFGLFLVAKSHQAVFGEMTNQHALIDSGVYSWIRHPMYLGILLLCLGFIFVSSSILSFGVFIIFFILYDIMTEYEEKDLIRKLGEKYIAYQKKVPKWFPRISRQRSLDNKLGKK